MRFCHHPLPALLLILSAHLLAVPLAVAQNVLIPLHVALPEGPDTRIAGFLIAQSRGYFTDVGLDVTFLKQGYGPSPIDRLVDTKADLAVEIMPIALTKRESGADVIHVAQIFQRATLGLYCRPSIDNPTKIAGHDVGVWLDGWESSFYAWLSRLGISYFATGGGVTVIRQGLDAEIFWENEVDCLTTTTYRAPFILGVDAVRVQSLVRYRYQDVDLGVLEDGIYVRGADLKVPARVDAFKRFMAAATRGWQSLQDDPADAERIIMELPDNARLNKSAVKESLAAISEAVRMGNVGLGTLDNAAYDRTIMLLLTSAPEPVLAAAPSGAVSPLLRQKP